MRLSQRCMEIESPSSVKTMCGSFETGPKMVLITQNGSQQMDVVVGHCFRLMVSILSLIFLMSLRYVNSPMLPLEGSMIAYTSLYSGDREAWLMPACGGHAKQLTHSSDARVVGWCNDRGSLLVQSGCRAHVDGFTEVVDNITSTAKLIP